MDSPLRRSGITPARQCLTIVRGEGFDVMGFATGEVSNNKTLHKNFLAGKQTTLAMQIPLWWV
jgi:hypothetical protein